VSFGQYLRQLRVAKGFKSARQFAETCQISNATVSRIEDESHNLSKQHLSNIENDRRLPSTELLRKFAEVLSVSYIGMLIKAGHVTEEEVLAERRSNGLIDSLSFGERLMIIRKRKGYMRQTDLAEASGVSQATLSRIEDGLQQPSEETLNKLKKVLGPF